MDKYLAATIDGQKEQTLNYVKLNARRQGMMGHQVRCFGSFQ